MFWRRKKSLEKNSVASLQVELGRLAALSIVCQSEDFAASVAATADEHRAELLERTLPKLYAVAPPPRAADGRPTLGFLQWRTKYFETLFAAFEAVGAAVVPRLRSIAFGERDWAQGFAVESLCRLAQSGIETEAIASDVIAALEVWDRQTLLNSRRALTQFAAHHERVRTAVHALITRLQREDVVDAFEYVFSLSVAVRSEARRYDDFLRRLADGEGLADRSGLEDGRVVEADGVITARDGIEYPAVEDFHRIRAALLLSENKPDDAGARALLQDWAQSHPAQQMRDELRSFLNRPATL